ncbi:WAS/WASL-interacting family protein [Trema orientale]|uniref:WAS/WASL-interacting family protein n=1 Tax=Trema orientale TaxID=63057 RepID=A0A2P5FEF6_TREOI|nr:WAS/WASL-interacting family protein [Trema orientale]
MATAPVSNSSMLSRLGEFMGIFERNRGLGIDTDIFVCLTGYLFMRTKKKDTEVEDKAVTPVSTTSAVTAPVEKPLPSPTIKEPPKLREPISENQQRELFKWILEEKRKVKTKDPEEKKRVDEEKDILKQFIRAKSVPSI